jgi:leader peptidase (prepilin peptidase)/N-methyltransferase
MIIAIASVFAAIIAATVIGTFWFTAAAGCDMVCGELPNVLVLLALLPTAMIAVILALQGSTTALPGIAFGAATWGLPLLLAHVIAPGALGFGDVKGATVAGAVLGLTQRPVVVAVAVAGMITSAATVGRVSGRSEIALGPYLAGGMIAAFVLGRLLSEGS